MRHVSEIFQEALNEAYRDPSRYGNNRHAGGSKPSTFLPAPRRPSRATVAARQPPKRPAPKASPGFDQGDGI